ncbi:unnamed protein product [Oppiella nova]|uniref:Caspase family p20 domain-containing protein n=1 Tax=Oppiella nova TaxID=334625 RepID=A0A7R9LSP3_9ACAR|nr:unnamed protein product [Oppiella nova]CAG2166608.1 unnamed protein product [Oppiella nova]
MFRDQFERLHFETYENNIITDLKGDEILSKLDDILGDTMQLNGHDAFVAVFSTHGDESVMSLKLLK